MTSFIDSLDREWNISLNVGSIERVEAKTGINLANPLAPFSNRPQTEQPDVLNMLRNNLGLFGAVLVALLSRQLKRVGIEVEDFLEDIDAESTQRAWLAFRKEWGDFFQSRNQPEMETLLKAQENGYQEVATDAASRAEKFVANIKSQLTSSPSPTSAPESAGLTPAA
jgi:hypothetical protein